MSKCPYIIATFGLSETASEAHFCKNSQCAQLSIKKLFSLRVNTQIVSDGQRRFTGKPFMSLVRTHRSSSVTELLVSKEQLDQDVKSIHFYLVVNLSSCLLMHCYFNFCDGGVGGEQRRYDMINVSYNKKSVSCWGIVKRFALNLKIVAYTACDSNEVPSTVHFLECSL